MRGRAYSVDLRERIVRAVQQGMSQPQAARQFSVSLASVERYLRLHREGQGLQARPRPGRSVSVLPPEEHEALREQVRAYPDLSLAEHAALWREDHSAASPSTLVRRFKALGLTRKKDTGGQ